MPEIKHQIPNRPPVPSLGSGVEDLRLEAASTPGFFGLGLYNVGLRQPGHYMRNLYIPNPVAAVPSRPL